MTRLLLVLWASLVSVDLERGMIIYKVPGKAWAEVTADGAGGGWWFWLVLPTHRCVCFFIAQNLTCFQCFNVSQASQCQPAECQPNEKVCVSREVLLNKSESVL
jgi:hypothetical protein